MIVKVVPGARRKRSRRNDFSLGRCFGVHTKRTTGPRAARTSRKGPKANRSVSRFTDCHRGDHHGTDSVHPDTRQNSVDCPAQADRCTEPCHSWHDSSASVLLGRVWLWNCLPAGPTSVSDVSTARHHHQRRPDSAGCHRRCDFVCPACSVSGKRCRFLPTRLWSNEQ